MQQRKKQCAQTRSIFFPACLCFILSGILLVGARFGGEKLIQELLRQLASSPTFVQTALTLETGLIPAHETVHKPSGSTLRANSSPVPSSDASAVMESSLPSDSPATPAPANAEPAAVKVNNQSGLEFDLPTLQAAAEPIRAQDGKPLVLVYHTHTTEAYTPHGSDTYVPSGEERTTDLTQSVVRVGDELCKVLEENGIKTIHLTDYNDYPAYNGSYGRSLTHLEEALKKYPSVQVTIDLHRDAILNEDGTPRALVTQIGNQEAAKLMLVLGTNASGLSHDHWRDNLGYAARLQSALNSDWPGLMRPINVRPHRFNMHLRRGSILLEVGTSGNTLQQAITAAQLFAHTLADELKG